MQNLVTRSRMAVAVAGCALVSAAGGAGIAFAFFTNEARSSGNQVATGTITLTGIDPAANNVLPPSPFGTVRPGGPDVTGVQALGNGGTVPGDLTVQVTQVVKLTTNNLSAVLRLSVDECTGGTGNTCTGPVNRYDGMLADATAPIALGTLSPSSGTSKRVRIRVYWPRTADNTALHNDEMGFRLNWRLRTS